MDSSKGLLRIICLDAHVPAKVMEIRVEDHANLSGTNGAGKTTLLKLVPFFYGASPSQVVQKAGKRQGFVDYYLPRPTSLLVFEYANDRGKMCVVAYRHASGEKPCYRFLAKPFVPEYFCDFRDDNYVYLEARALAQHWLNHHLSFSRQIENVTDYRAIIQGDRSLINRSSNGSDLRGLAHAYGITGQIGKMRYLEKMALAILGRSGDMDRIKDMLADIMEEDGLTLPRLSLHKEVESNVGQLVTLRELDRHEALFEETVANGRRYYQHTARQESLSVAFRQIRTQLERDREMAEQKGLSLDQSISDLKQRAAEEETRLQREEIRASADLKQCEEALDTLTREYETWEKRDIEKKKAAFQGLEALLDAHALAETELKGLLSEVGDLSAWHERQQKEEIKRYQTKKQTLDAVIADSKAQIEQAKLTLSGQILQAEREASGRKADYLASRSSALDEKKEAIFQARVTAETRIFTEEEQLQEEEAQLLVEEAESVLHQVEDRLYEKEQERNTTGEAVRQLDADYEAAQRRISKETEKYDRQVAIFRPEAGTLLAALKKEGNVFEPTLGKVLREDLLHRKDLSPVKDENKACDSLFGWQLDLDRIALPEWALSSQEQEAALAQQEQTLALVTAQAETLADRRKGKQAEFAEKTGQYENLQTEKGIKKQQCTAAVSALKQLKNQLADQAEKRKTAARSHLKTLEADRDAYQQETKKGERDLNERLSETVNDLTAASHLEQSRLTQALEQHEATLAEEKLTHKRNLDDMSASFKAQCSERGLDESVLRKAEEKEQRLLKEIREIRTYADQIHEHARWLSTCWSKQADMVTAADEARKCEAEAITALKVAREDFQHGLQSLSQQKRETEQALVLVQKKITQCSEVLGRLPAVLQPATADEAVPVSQLDALQEEAEQSLETLRQLLNDIRKGISKAENIILRSGNENPVFEAWMLLRDEQENALQDPHDQERLAVALTVALDKFIHEHMPQKRHALVLFLENTGNQLANFYIGLTNVSGAIQSQSRQISGTISTGMRFDAIRDISVSLESRIDTQDYWPLLKDFYSHWQDWKTTNVQQLPPEKLTEGLLAVTGVLHRTHLHQNIAGVFDLVISLEENGRRTSVSRNSDLENVSSTGLSYLIICSIYAGISRMLCRDESVRLHWPMDELGTLAPENVAKLFVMLDAHRINVLGGFPSTDPNLLQHFKRMHEIRKQEGIVDLALPEDRLQQIMQQRLNEKAELTAEAS